MAAEIKRDLGELAVALQAVKEQAEQTSLALKEASNQVDVLKEKLNAFKDLNFEVKI